jgi:malate dehydrogenase
MKKIVVTGGAGQIAYNLLFSLANGDLFGSNEPLSLQLLEIPEALPALEGVKMELEDCAFPLLQEIRIGSDPEKIFEGATHAFLLGAKPRGPGMERSDLLKENGVIFIDQGKALNRKADKNVKVLVVGNPCNTNCLIALKNAPDLNPRHFFAMTALDERRAQHQVAKKHGMGVKDVSKITIWGNHSSTLVPDVSHATILGRPAKDHFSDPSWLRGEFVSTVQQRGAAIIKARGKSSAASAAHSALNAMKSIITPTLAGQWYSMGVYSKGNPYGIDQDLVFSFPCRTDVGGEVSIVPGLAWDDWLKEKIKLSEQELQQEREAIKPL